MRKPLTTFISGVIIGAAGVLVGVYVAGLQRPVPTVPQISVVQTPPVTGWEHYNALERSIPKHLQECVARETEAASQRERARQFREERFRLERALGACLTMQKPPKTVAQR
jgi:hypothetical protein